VYFSYKLGIYSYGKWVSVTPCCTDESGDATVTPIQERFLVGYYISESIIMIYAKCTHIHLQYLFVLDINGFLISLSTAQ
jgi:hypothetical protein